MRMARGAPGRACEGAVTAAVPNSLASTAALALERHYSPDELASIWNLSADTVRRLFEREPGVLIIEHTKNSARRRYRTLRITESVALRVHRRMTNSIAMLSR
jgi:transcriptional regulator GlxA family with amidase domain